MKNRFWQMWKVSIKSHIWYVLTPWFCLEIGSGAVDWYHLHGCWSGMRFHYCHKPRWIYCEGDVMFSRSDMYLSRHYWTIWPTYRRIRSGE